MKKIVIALVALAAATPALAQPYRYGAAPGAPYAEPDVTGSIVVPVPGYRVRHAPVPFTGAERYSLNPAADGNANLQAQAVPNYGGVSGGYKAAW
jgi:hypothetical protein